MDLFTQTEQILRYDELEVGSEYVLAEGTNKIYNFDGGSVGWCKKGTSFTVTEKQQEKVYFSGRLHTNLYMINNQRVKLLVKN